MAEFWKVKKESTTQAPSRSKPPAKSSSTSKRDHGTQRGNQSGTKRARKETEIDWPSESSNWERDVEKVETVMRSNVGELLVYLVW